jgi:hypothetical protein
MPDNEELETQKEKTVTPRDIAPAEPTPEEEPAPKEDKPKKSAAVSSAVPTTIPEGLKVELSKVVFQSLYERNSRSVGLIQIRLIELGYMSAGADKRGYLSVGTKKALEEYATKKKTGNFDSEETIKSVFQGTPVTVVP